jgi:hypothetical protein
MRVQSIWTAIQIRHPARNRFLGPTRQVPFGEVNRIAKLHHVVQKVRPMTEALQNARHLLAARFCAPLVVDLRNLAGRFSVFDKPDLRRIFCHREGKRIGTTISRSISAQISAERLSARGLQHQTHVVLFARDPLPIQILEQGNGVLTCKASQYFECSYIDGLPAHLRQATGK